jgi:hypothetical protein
MPRGRPSKVGDVTVNANGYSQTKTETGWVGTHQLVLEEKLGRKLLPGERAIFIDGDRTNLHPDNIDLNKSSVSQSIKAKIAKLQSEIEDRQALIKDLEKEWNLLQEAPTSTDGDTTT